MDNHTIQMTCEQVEDELSGYLDDVLDPQLRRSVEAHLATCVACPVMLADFQRGDEMLRALPFIEPPSDMRDRFFNSPRYLKLAEARAHPRNFITPLTAALVAAAMLVVALGGALLIRQGVFAPQQATKSGTMTTIGNPGDGAPLPAGPRLIYERGGALWSAAESGAGLPRQLTPAGIQVAGWSVSPNGRAVIYIDAHTGALHAIRADALNDTVIGTVTGGKAPPAGFWSTATGVAIAGGLAWSPDNTRVAYVAQGNGGAALHVMNATGAADTVAQSVTGGLIGHPLWSADSVYIAYTISPAPASDVQGLAVYNVTTAVVTPIAAPADANAPTAIVGQLAWLPNHTPATLTWAAHADRRGHGRLPCPGGVGACSDPADTRWNHLHRRRRVVHWRLAAGQRPHPLDDCRRPDESTRRHDAGAYSHAGGLGAFGAGGRSAIGRRALVADSRRWPGHDSPWPDGAESGGLVACRAPPWHGSRAIPW